MQQQHIGHHRHSYYEALNTFMLFLSEMLSMVIGTNDITHGFLFLGINGVLIHQLALVNSLAFEKRNLLSLGEAFDMSLPPIVHISMMFFIFPLNLVLLFPVYPGTQCVLLLLCILMPLYYVAELAHKAAGIAVELEAKASNNIGVHYGQLGNNLPSPYLSVELLTKMKARHVKLYDANPDILKHFREPKSSGRMGEEQCPTLPSQNQDSLPPRRQ
ncbi:putative glucan endo-1,3-beta-glucosidase [Arachis hypogaea]|nr:putative glucan endo-1,3-beta-glucosidase [Arachis hypogaea]